MVFRMSSYFSAEIQNSIWFNIVFNSRSKYIAMAKIAVAHLQLCFDGID